MRFVHCADLHLDTVFSGLKDEQSSVLRQRELRGTFSAIIDLAKTADALFIAGDLFDQDSVEPETLHVLRQGFASLGEIPVFIAAGNHDPLCAASYYRVADFPENVHVFGHEIEKISLPDCDIYGVSFKSAVADASLLEGFTADGEKPSVLLVHGNLAGEGYNPINREMAMGFGVSYLALGHVHAYAETRLGKTLCAYPGCPEGRGFDELGEKGVIVGEINESGVKTEFVPLCRRQYQEISLDISGVFTHEAVVAKVKEAGLCEKNLYKIILAGETELAIDVGSLAADFPEFFFVKFYDRTCCPVDLAALAEESGVRGMFVKKLLPEVSAGNEQAMRALQFGLSALSGEKVKPQ